MHKKVWFKHWLICFFLLFSGLTLLKAQEKFSLSGSAFKNGEMIPVQYTCEGKNILPGLHWSHAPNDTKSFAIIMDDPDAPMGVWVHWVVYNIPATLDKISDGANADSIKAIDGLNSWESKGYSGPCPPGGVHNYIFKIYALDITLTTPGLTKESLLDAVKGHILAQTELNGKFGM